jgi:uncharacterized protein (TIGR00299 family) protein
VIEPFGGLAGDMLLAALLDLRDERFALDDLRALARAIVPGEVEISAEVAWRGSLSGLALTVRTGESASPPHRHFSDCAALIERAPMSSAARERARAVLWRIAVAEARVHGTTPDEIHFHEVGAADALIDVCGAALALERLEVERVLATPPLVGSGTVRCAHGEMPVPAPATAELLRGVPCVHGGGGERLTPTGAALLAGLAERFEPPGAFVTRAIGYGAGHRDPREGPPNIARVQLGVEVAASAARGGAEAWEMAANLDDMTGEEIGFLAGALRAAGALDVWTAGVHMKKDRPGVVVSALCRGERRGALETALFAHSTTLGVRWTRTERTECAREPFTVEVRGREIRGLRRLRPSAPRHPVDARDLSFEYDDLAAVAAASGLSLREVERLALAAARATPP